LKNSLKSKNIFCSVNTFQTLPPFYQLINCSFLDESEDVLLIHNSINGFEKQTSKHYLREISILHFQNLLQFQNQNFILKVWKYLRLIKFLIIHILLKNKNARIFTFDIFTTVVAVLLKKNNKIIYLQYEMIEESQLNRFDKLLFKRMIRLKDKIDLIITPEENRTNYLMAQLRSTRKEKFFTFPNSNNNEIDLIIDKDSNNTKPIVVTHIGAVGLDHNIKVFMNAVKKCDPEKYEFRFIGLLHEDVEKLIISYNLKNVKIIGQIPHDNLKLHYLETDIGVILYKDNGLNYRFCAPNKLYEYWSYGIQVIGDVLPGLKSVFNNECLGCLVNMSDSNSIYTTILKLAEKKNKIEVKEYFNRNYKLNVFESSLKTRLQSL
jgi:glycosyltransferase involved in cell wall biosynthesis